jgi:hypothetical protein
MRGLAPDRPAPRTLVPVAPGLPWLGLAVLPLAARGNPESFLRRAFGPYSRADVFAHLSGILVPFLVVQTFLVLVASAVVGAAYWFVRLAAGPG